MPCHLPQKSRPRRILRESQFNALIFQMGKPRPETARELPKAPQSLSPEVPTPGGLRTAGRAWGPDTHGPDSTWMEPTFSSRLSVRLVQSADSSHRLPWKFSISYTITWKGSVLRSHRVGPPAPGPVGYSPAVWDCWAAAWSQHRRRLALAPWWPRRELQQEPQLNLGLQLRV